MPVENPVETVHKLRKTPLPPPLPHFPAGANFANPRGRRMFKSSIYHLSLIYERT